MASLRTIRVRSAPDGYPTVRSGLGKAPPRDILVLPVVFEGEPLGVIELASFASLSDLHIAFMERLVSTIGVALNTIMEQADGTTSRKYGGTGLRLSISRELAKLRGAAAEAIDVLDAVRT